MKSLFEVLRNIIPINEALTGFVFAFGPKDGRLLSDPTFQKVLSGMPEDKYVDTVIGAMKNPTTADKNLIAAATKEWYDEGHDLVDIPFTFNQEGKLKLRLVIAAKLKYSHGDKATSNITVGDGSISMGKGITTRDQELATTIVWNRMRKSAENGEMNMLSIDDIQAACMSLDIDLPKSWAKSCSDQCVALAKFLRKEKYNPNEYQATRFGENDEMGEFGKIYGQFVQAYSRSAEQAKWDEGYTIKGNIPKDNYDPSDIILYRHKIKDAAAKINKCQSLLPDWEAARDEYLKYFKAGDIMGVSLKKISSKDVEVEYFNIGDGKQVCEADKISKITYSHVQGSKLENTDKTDATGCYVFIDGKFKFSGITDIETAGDVADDKNKIPSNIETDCVVLNLRSFGSIGIDIKFVHNGRAGISLGKIPVRFWKKRTGIDSTDVHECALKFAEWANRAKNSDLTYLIQEGIKAGPWCLPFVLIH